MPEKSEQKRQRRSGQRGGGGSPVYGLGFIGAVVWYWRQAPDAQGRATGVLKAMVWPAFLVYEAYRALSRVESDENFRLAA